MLLPRSARAIRLSRTECPTRGKGGRGREEREPARRPLLHLPSQSSPLGSRTPPSPAGWLALLAGRQLHLPCTPSPLSITHWILTPVPPPTPPARKSESSLRLWILRLQPGQARRLTCIFPFNQLLLRLRTRGSRLWIYHRCLLPACLFSTPRRAADPRRFLRGGGRKAPLRCVCVNGWPFFTRIGHFPSHLL